MTTAEKARAYDEALEKAKEYWEIDTDNKMEVHAKGIMEYLFPELQKSGDEKIRKELLEWLKSNGEKTLPTDRFNDVIAWLERQGEQKVFDYEDAYIPQRDFAPKTELEAIHEEKPDNTNKVVEPKFHDGEWIVNNNSGGVYQVTEIRDDEYCLWPLYGEIMGYLRIIDVDNDFHVWTIEDARDGDVLASDFDIIIFKECTYNKKDMTGCMFAYCSCGWWHELGGMNPVYYRPASNGERDLLFQRMKEAGYTFDFEKKELRKVDTYCQEHCKGYQETGRCFADGECQAKRDADSACRMDDKKMVDLLIDIFTVNYPNCFYKTNPANTLNMQGISSSEIIRWLKEVKAGMV